jgi:hypothetical protein
MDTPINLRWVLAHLLQETARPRRARRHPPRTDRRPHRPVGMELVDGCTLRYPAPDFPTAYQVADLIALLGGR